MIDMSTAGEAVAVIGMSGRFPGAADLDELWDALVTGAEGVTRFSREELERAGVPAHLRDDPAYVPAAGVLDGPGRFDAEFFGFTRSEAELTDPQHRLLLEGAWHALEDAGHVPGQGAGRVGVFASASTSRYRFDRIARRDGAQRSSHPLQVAMGNDLDMLALRLSYKLDLTGPSVTVQTACSSSLVAVHLACQSLLIRESDVALAGGSAVRLLSREGYRYDEGGILSKDGHCRPFDAAATGTVVGDGVGVVVLKRLEDAIADGDHVRAVILGSAVNNDGAAKAGFTAPSPSGQAAVIAEALAVAGVDPATIQYVEAHGTATPLGDPIEIRALTEAFGAGVTPGSCLLGSVKSNLGHLDTAAGVAGLIKAVLALEHRFVPPTLHFRTPNPQTGLDSSPFRVNTEAVAWPVAEQRPRAAVSSFGMGGTNVHMVLEAAPAVPATDARRAWHILPVSARTAGALDAATARLAAAVRRDAGAALADVGYTLQVGRSAFAHRRAVVCRDRDGAAAALSADAGSPAPAHHHDTPPSVVFMFPGQGSQYPGMGAQLYDSEPVFQAAIDDCADGLRAQLGWDVREVAFAAAGDAARERLRQTLYTQPTMFSLDYALARLLMASGVRPAAMIGHSLGELVAACLAGVLGLEDALRVVATRARLMQELPEGRMLTAALDEATLRGVLDGHGSVAVINAPSSCVVAGSVDEIAESKRRLEQHGVYARELEISHAFHTPHVEPALPELAAVMRTTPLGPPTVPFVSNVTGTWITDAQATDPEYWVSHARRPVRFADGVSTLLARDAGAVVVEVGPGSALSTLVRAIRQPANGAPPAIVTPLRRRRGHATDEARSLAEGIAELWQRGVNLDWAALHAGEPRRRVPLPTYPFERRDYLLPRPDEDACAAPQAAPARRDRARWSHAPVWRRAPLHPVAEPESEPSTWLMLADDQGLAARLATALRRRGHTVTTVRPHEAFDRAGEEAFLVDPARPEDLRRLVEELRRDGRLPSRVVHAWSVTADEPAAAGERFRASQDLGFFSLVGLAQALSDSEPVRVDVLTNDLQDVLGEPVRLPERATVLGAATVLGQEFAPLTAHCVDVRLPRDDGWEPLVDQLVAELAHPPSDGPVAYRGTQRWGRAFAPVSLTPAPAATAWNGDGGYLVTGVAAEAGLAFAEHLAASGARLVLVGDDRLPCRERWDGWRAAHPPDDPVCRRIDRLAALEAARPGDVTFLAADLADPDGVRHTVELARSRLARIRGVVHAVDTRASGLAAFKGREQSAGVLASTVRSTLLLDELLADDDLEVFLAVSSTVGILGGAGQLESCAVATFLDAFAEARAATGAPTVAIDWGQWEWDDWNERQAARMPELRERLERHRRDYGIPVADGMAVADAAVASGLARVVVSTVDFQDVLEDQASLTPAALTPSRDELAGGGWDPAAVWPDDEVARSVATVWHEVLGVSHFGAEDDFFELGGNSLFAMQIVARLRELHGDLPMSVIFEAATVPGVAAAIRERQAETIGLDDFDALLREIERLSPDEARIRLGGHDA